MEERFCCAFTFLVILVLVKGTLFTFLLRSPSKLASKTQRGVFSRAFITVSIVVVLFLPYSFHFHMMDYVQIVRFSRHEILLVLVTVQ